MRVANQPVQSANIHVHLVLVRPRAHNQHLQFVRVDLSFLAVKATEVCEPAHRDHASGAALVQQATFSAAFVELRANARSPTPRLRTRPHSTFRSRLPRVGRLVHTTRALVQHERFRVHRAHTRVVEVLPQAAQVQSVVRGRRQRGRFQRRRVVGVQEEFGGFQRC